jgi:hypothetical protein
LCKGHLPVSKLKPDQCIANIMKKCQLLRGPGEDAEGHSGEGGEGVQQHTLGAETEVEVGGAVGEGETPNLGTIGGEAQQQSLRTTEQLLQEAHARRREEEAILGRLSEEERTLNEELRRVRQSMDAHRHGERHAHAGEWTRLSGEESTLIIGLGKVASRLQAEKERQRRRRLRGKPCTTPSSGGVGFASGEEGGAGKGMCPVASVSQLFQNQRWPGSEQDVMLQHARNLLSDGGERLRPHLHGVTPNQYGEEVWLEADESANSLRWECGVHDAEGGMEPSEFECMMDGVWGGIYGGCPPSRVGGNPIPPEPDVDYCLLLTRVIQEGFFIGDMTMVHAMVNEHAQAAMTTGVMRQPLVVGYVLACGRALEVTHGGHLPGEARHGGFIILEKWHFRWRHHAPGEFVCEPHTAESVAGELGEACGFEVGFAPESGNGGVSREGDVPPGMESHRQGGDAHEGVEEPGAQSMCDGQGVCGLRSLAGMADELEEHILKICNNKLAGVVWPRVTSTPRVPTRQFSGLLVGAPKLKGRQVGPARLAAMQLTGKMRQPTPVWMRVQPMHLQRAHTTIEQHLDLSGGDNSSMQGGLSTKAAWHCNMELVLGVMMELVATKGGQHWMDALMLGATRRWGHNKYIWDSIVEDVRHNRVLEPKGVEYLSKEYMHLVEDLEEADPEIHMKLFSLLDNGMGWMSPVYMYATIVQIGHRWSWHIPLKCVVDDMKKWHFSIVMLGFDFQIGELKSGPCTWVCPLVPVVPVLPAHRHCDAFYKTIHSTTHGRVFPPSRDMGRLVCVQGHCYYEPDGYEYGDMPDAANRTEQSDTDNYVGSTCRLLTGRVCTMCMRDQAKVGHGVCGIDDPMLVRALDAVGARLASLT